MKQVFSFLLAVAFFTSCSSNQYTHPHVLIETEAGDIEVELYTDKAPKTAGTFLQNVEDGLYRKSTFYRILNYVNQPSNAPKSELIQGGIWKSDYKKASSLPGIPHESTKQTGILHHNGILSMARLEPGTASSEFFICIGDQPGFNFGGDNNTDGQGYAPFGKVVKGMDIVNRIYNRPENDQAFTPQVSIWNIKKL